MPSGFDPIDLDIFSERQPRKISSVSLTSIGELLKEPPPEYHWIVDGLLLRGGFSLLCGKPKSGKSTLSRCLALAVTRGQPFLGRNTVQGGVVMFTLEDHRFMLKESFQKLGATGEENLLIHSCRRLRVSNKSRQESWNTTCQFAWLEKQIWAFNGCPSSE